ncbi:MAG: DNA methyltransferase [Flavobacteriales bacterium]
MRAEVVTYSTAELAEVFMVKESSINDYLTSQNIVIKEDGRISERDYQTVIDFVETQEKRIERALQKKKSEFTTKDKAVSIYQDDAISFLKKLPSNSVDVIVTDPAYSGMNNMLQLGEGRIVGKYADKGADQGKWFNEFEDSEENYAAFLIECKRVLKRSTGHIYIMFDSYSLLSLGGVVRKYLDVKNLITWDKVNMGMGHYFRRRHEYILFATNGNKRKIETRSMPDVWRFKRIHNSEYPTQKPVEVFQAMLHASAEPGYVVCDPFLGSASSAIAAMKCKCKFIGCDISDKSIQVAARRIEQFHAKGKDPLQAGSSAVEETVFWE